MRDYGKCFPQFWTGKTGRQLREAGRDVQTVAFYLFSCPSSNMIGLYYLPLPTLCHEIGISPQGATKALQSLSEAHFAHYDAEEEVMWVPEMARFQIAEQLKPADLRVIGIARELVQFRKSCFFKRFYEKYREPFCLDTEKAHEILQRALEGPCEPLRSQEQEQEQEQENDLETSSLVLASEHDNKVNKKTTQRNIPLFGDWPSVEAFVNLYNTATPDECLAVQPPLSEQRLKKVRLYLKFFPEQTYWQEVYQQIHASQFLRGMRPNANNGHGNFRADFDWLLSKGKTDTTENFVKVHDGRYHN